MNERTTISALKKSKKEAQSTLHSLEIEIGHDLLKKPEKTMDKAVLATYKSFNTDIDALHAVQENINSLTAKRKTLQIQIAELKKLLSTLKSQLPDAHKTLGQSLFSNYTATYSDCFGDIYTQTAIQEQRIAIERKKEASIRDDIDKASFFPRIIKHVQVGAAKNQLATSEQRRDTLLTKGARAAIENGKIVKLLQNEQLDENSEQILNEYLELQETLRLNQVEFETLTINEGAVANELFKNGAGGSILTQKRIQNIDKEIERKKVEQDEFSATQGHEYACRYVSPDGETIVDFPSNIAASLSDIQRQRLAMMSYSRQIEILQLSQVCEDTQNRLQSYSRTIASNKDKIVSMQQQNEELSSKTKTAQSELQVLTAKKEALEAEENAASKCSEWIEST